MNDFIWDTEVKEIELSFLNRMIYNKVWNGKNSIPKIMKRKSHLCKASFSNFSKQDTFFFSLSKNNLQPSREMRWICSKREALSTKPKIWGSKNFYKNLKFFENFLWNFFWKDFKQDCQSEQKFLEFFFGQNSISSELKIFALDFWKEGRNFFWARGELRKEFSFWKPKKILVLTKKFSFSLYCLCTNQTYDLLYIIWFRKKWPIYLTNFFRSYVWIQTSQNYPSFFVLDAFILTFINAKQKKDYEDQLYLKDLIDLWWKINHSC